MNAIVIPSKKPKDRSALRGRIRGWIDEAVKARLEEANGAMGDNEDGSVDGSFDEGDEDDELGEG